MSALISSLTGCSACVSCAARGWKLEVTVGCKGVGTAFSATLFFFSMSQTAVNAVSSARMKTSELRALTRLLSMGVSSSLVIGVQAARAGLPWEATKTSPSGFQSAARTIGSMAKTLFRPQATLTIRLGNSSWAPCT